MQRSAILLLACSLACASACSQVFFGDSSLHAHGRRLTAVSALGALAMHARCCAGLGRGRAIHAAAHRPRSLPPRLIPYPLPPSSHLSDCGRLVEL